MNSEIIALKNGCSKIEEENEGKLRELNDIHGQKEEVEKRLKISLNERKEFLEKSIEIEKKLEDTRDQFKQACIHIDSHFQQLSPYFNSETKNKLSILKTEIKTNEENIANLNKEIAELEKKN